MAGDQANGTDGDGVFGVARPTGSQCPLVVASPHSGSDYPADFIAASRLDPLALRRSEDSFVDDLFAAAPALGAPLLCARFPRAYLDVNREPYELDPAMFSDALPRYVNAASPRVRMGLGTIARIVANGEEIYAGKLRFAEAERRIDRLYRPYHAALRGLLEDTYRRFGFYLLLDCHSMPSAAGAGCAAGGADIVLGDCHGIACAREFLDTARDFLGARGFAVAVNAPYAGGFTTSHYGHPRLRRHALQIEVNRGLYMDEGAYRRKPNFARLAATMAELVDCLSGAARRLAAIDPSPPRAHLQSNASGGGANGNGQARFHDRAALGKL
jgi:N-formylglutamate amidohydrolase